MLSLIPAKDMQRVNEEMVGNFGGVGVQFYKYLDTVTVVKVVPGGPSEAAGLQDGDRIVKVNDSIVAGRNMNTDKIMSLMRGEIGTDVQLTIVRRGEKQPLIKNITRGSIPIKSVDVAYMFDDTTGFIKVKTFGMNTYDEFMASLAKLEGLGMKRLIVDLRENEGGILPIAIRMINEFLPEGKLILYTQGKASPRMDYNSNGKGKYQQLPLTVLIDEASASASEIFAGAIQDNDRGNIVGRRSFGKGLVQEQRLLPDNSALRLTVLFKNLMTKEKKNIIQIFINACCMGNFLRKIVYILMKNLNSRRLADVRYTVAAESCPICSYPEIRSVSPVIWWR